MADKDILALIRKREAERGQGVHTALMAELGGEIFNDEVPAALAAAMTWLIKDLQDVAELYLRAQMRGGKGSADDLKTTAGMLAPIANQLRKLGSDTPAAAPSRGGPSVPAEWCGKTEDHGSHYWERELPIGLDPLDRGPLRRQCLGRQARDTSGLDALIAERIASPVGASAATEAYLRGAANDIPGSAPLGPGSVTSAPESDNPFDQVTPLPMPPFTFDDPDPVGWSTPTTSADGYRLPGNVPIGFDDPAPRRGSLGTKISWSDLRELHGKDRRGAGLPLHLSHSQIDTLGDCSLKYVMQRDEQLGVVEIPQWALIGGSAFHAAVEWFERTVAEVRTLQHVKDRLQSFARELRADLAAPRGEVLWQWAFGQQITETAMKSPVPQDDWRASKQGMEGYTWWLINGGDMVQRYLDARLTEIGGTGWRTIRMTPTQVGFDGPDGSHEPMIEWEYLADVEGVPFKGVIDQVWDITWQHGDMMPGDLLIDDCKSGAKVGPDTGQLGEYALWLSRFGGGEDRRIWGRYYDARRGTWTEPVDLLARHEWVELEVKVLDADARKAGGLFTPNRTNFCGGCSVKHACPIFASGS